MKTNIDSMNEVFFFPFLQNAKVAILNVTVVLQITTFIYILDVYYGFHSQFGDFIYDFF